MQGNSSPSATRYEIEKKPGQITTGTVFTIDDVEVTAAEYAERFNTYDDTYQCIATGAHAHAEGRKTKATGNYGSHAEGAETSASGSASHAEGGGTIASGNSAHAEGNGCKAIGDYTHAEGANTEATNSWAHAEGDQSVASGEMSHAEGFRTTASGDYGSHAEGRESKASGDSSHAEGQHTMSEGLCSHTEGCVTGATGHSAHAEGNATSAIGNHSHAEGDHSKAEGLSSHAEGEYTIASEVSCHAEGYQTTASGIYSHAEGYQTTASGQYSHTEGYKTIASGKYSHAEGNQATASGNYSYARDSGTASGEHSYASGLYCVAEKADSYAIGYNCQATESSAFALGTGAVASGVYAFAFNGTASGWNSCAVNSATASGTQSHAEGWQTIADNECASSQGKFNKHMAAGSMSNINGDAMIIGNGLEDNARSNCFRVTFAGATYGLSAFNSSGADYAEYFEWLDGNLSNEDRVGYFVTLLGEKIVKAKAGDYILGVVSGQPCIIGNADEDWLGRWEHDEFGRFIKEDTYKLKIDEYGCPIEGEYELDEFGHRIIDGWKYKQNPEYDSSQTYIERKDRKEWSAVGMLGVLAVRDDGSCVVNGYAQVTDQGTATQAEVPAANTYRVIKRVSGNVVQIVFR